MTKLANLPSDEEAILNLLNFNLLINDTLPTLTDSAIPYLILN